MRLKTAVMAPVFCLTILTLTGAAQAQSGGNRSALFMDLMREGKALAEKGFYYEASVAFNGILERGDPVEPYFMEAEFEIARSLYDLGLVYSAFSYFARIADTGETHPKYQETLGWFLRIHNSMPGLIASTEYMSQYPENFYSKELADELHFVVGQYFYSIDDYDSALAHLSKVGQANPDFFLRSRYLVAVVYVRQKDRKKALTAFKDILRYKRDTGISTDVANRIVSDSVMGIARNFFATKQYDLALKYYDAIEKYSDNWLQSLFEKSWTYFLMGDFERAMGNLHTLNSPYFDEQYFPESQVLQAVILYSNCRYDDAIMVVEKFVKSYDVLRKELSTNLKQNEDPTDFYYWLSTLGKKGNRFSARLKRIFNVALKDQKLYRLFSLILSLNQEEALLQAMKKSAVQKELAARLLSELVTYRELAIGETGDVARSRLSVVHNDLRKLVSRAMKVKFESLNDLKEIMEGGKGSDMIAGKKVDRSVSSELYVNWPFEGEYWKDELDSYLFRVDNLCPTKK